MRVYCLRYTDTDGHEGHSPTLMEGQGGWHSPLVASHASARDAAAYCVRNMADGTYVFAVVNGSHEMNIVHVVKPHPPVQQPPVRIDVTGQL